MRPYLSLSSRVISFFRVISLLLVLSARAEEPDTVSRAGQAVSPDSVTIPPTVTTDTVSSPEPEVLSDSAAADTTARRYRKIFIALDSLSRGMTGLTAGRGEVYEAGLNALELSRPVNLADMLYPLPGFGAGDSLGHGYPVGFSYMGAGFDQVRPSLNGMPLVDPLTGVFDYRSVNPEILQRLSLTPGAVGRGPYGGAAALELGSLFSAPGETFSRLGISGGAYEINRMGGGLRRGLFKRGALHVDINKIQQSDEHFRRDFENIQFYSRLQQCLGDNAILSVDGLYFSDIRKPAGVSPRHKNDDMHIQVALSGRLGQAGNTFYNLAWRHAGSQNFYSTDSSQIFLKARSRGYAASLGHKFGEYLRLGFKAEGAHDRAINFDLTPGAVWNHFVGLEGDYAFPAGLELSSAGGYRLAGHTGNNPVFNLSLARPAGEAKIGFYSGLTLETLTPSLLTLARITAGTTGEALEAGRMNRAEGGLEFVPRPGMRLRGGLIYTDVSDHPYSPFNPDPFSNEPVRWLDYSVSGVNWSLESPLFRRLFFSARGLQLFETPAEVPWMPGANHSASLSTGGDMFRRDMSFTIQAEVRYTGEMRYIPAGNPTLLVLQPARLDLGGAATVRIIDLLIYGRVDHLLGNYYNNTDPLPIPAPRAVFGVSWLFQD